MMSYLHRETMSAWILAVALVGCCNCPDPERSTQASAFDAVAKVGDVLHVYLDARSIVSGRLEPLPITADALALDAALLDSPEFVASESVVFPFSLPQAERRGVWQLTKATAFELAGDEVLRQRKLDTVGQTFEACWSDNPSRMFSFTVPDADRLKSVHLELTVVERGSWIKITGQTGCRVRDYRMRGSK